MELYNADCIKAMSVLDDNSIDMVFCDLPYGTTQNPWDSIIPFEDLWAAYDRIVKQDGAILLMAQPPFDKLLGASNLKDFRYEWNWEKNKATGHLNAKKMPMKAHEMILVFYKKLPTYNPQMTEGHKPMNAVLPRDNMPEPEVKRNYNHVEKRTGNPGGSTTRYPRDVVRFPVINNDSPLKFHPTQKPVELIEYFIKTYSNEGDVVLDNAMGSGSTGVAAQNLNREFIGIENNKEYFDQAVSWIKSENLLTASTQ